MSTEFEWRFGDDLPEEVSNKGRPQSRPWRKWLAWGLVLLLIVGGAYAWWLGRQRTLDQAETEVQQVARLELRAQISGDRELFMSLQDGANGAWREAQATYTETAALPPPIQSLTMTQTSVGSARIVGDRAHVEIQYTAMLPDGRCASFQATRFYRPTIDGRWLHTPIDADAVGETVVFTGAFVELAAFEADGDWVEPLAYRLEGMAHEFCEVISCRQGLPARFDLAASLHGEEGADDLALPAPLLVGAPRNEAAREAWTATLQVLLLDHLVTRETGRRADEVAGALFEDRLTAWFSARLDIDSGDPSYLDRTGDTLGEAASTGLWIPTGELYKLASEDPRRSLAEAQVDLLLDFLEREYGSSAVAKLVHAFEDADSTRELLTSIVDQPWFDFESRYLAYLREATAERVDDLAAFASYDLLVSCWGPTGSFLELRGLRLNQPGTTLLSAGSESGPLRLVDWSPDGSALLLRRQTLDEGYLFLMEGSSALRPFRELPDSAEYVRSFGLGYEGGWSAEGHYLAYRTLGPSPEDGVVNFDTGERVSLGGSFVAWSPENARLIYAEPTSWHWTPESDVATFWLQDVGSGSARRLGQGYDAAWSPGGTRIALVSSEPAVKAHYLETEETVTMLDNEALRGTLGFTPTLSLAAGRPFQVAWSPGGERIALGATRFGDDEPEESLTILLEKGTHRVLHRQAGGVYDVVWSPDGRWLTTVTFGRERFKSVVTDVAGDTLIGAKDGFVFRAPEGHYLALGQGPVPLRVLEIESGEWQSFEAPADCWLPMWNPRATRGNQEDRCGSGAVARWTALRLGGPYADRSHLTLDLTSTRLSGR